MAFSFCSSTAVSVSTPTNTYPRAVPHGAVIFSAFLFITHLLFAVQRTGARRHLQQRLLFPRRLIRCTGEPCQLQWTEDTALAQSGPPVHRRRVCSRGKRPGKVAGNGQASDFLPGNGSREDTTEKNTIFPAGADNALSEDVEGE